MDRLHEVADEMDTEDGVIWAYGDGDDGVMAFTNFSIETFTDLIEMHKQGPATRSIHQTVQYKTIYTAREFLEWLTQASRTKRSAAVNRTEAGGDRRHQAEGAATVRRSSRRSDISSPSFPPLGIRQQIAHLPPPLPRPNYHFCFCLPRALCGSHITPFKAK